MVGTITDLQDTAADYTVDYTAQAVLSDLEAPAVSPALTASNQTLSTPSNQCISSKNKSVLARALLGVALGSFELLSPSSHLSAQEVPPDKNAQHADSPAKVERTALLHKISTIAGSSIPLPGNESIIHKIGEIRPLVAQYKHLLNGPNPPDLPELAQARALVFTPLNTLTFSANIPQQHSRPFFQECVIELYSDISKHLRRRASESPLYAQTVAEELDRIFKDTLYIAHHHDPVLCAGAVGIIEQQFLTKDEGTFARTYRAISARPLFSTEYTYAPMAGLFAFKYLKEISEGIHAEVSHAVKQETLPDTAAIVELLEIPQRIRRDLIAARNSAVLTEVECEERMKGVTELLQVPIEKVATQLWMKSYRERNPFIQPGQLAEFGRFLFSDNQDISDRVTLPIRDAQSIALCNLYEDSPACRVRLGDQFIKDLYGDGTATTTTPVPALQVLYVITHLAPRPENKKVLVEALRNAVRTVPTSISKEKQDINPSTTQHPITDYLSSERLVSKLLTSDHLGALLSMVLLTDFSFCATSECGGRNPQLGTSLIRELGSSTESIDAYREILSPAQLLLIEVMRIQRGGSHAESVPWYATLSLAEKTALRQESTKILTSLVTTIYDVQPIGIFSPKKAEFTFVSYPDNLRAGVIRAPDLTRVEPFQRAVGAFCELGDVIASGLVTPVRESQSERDEIIHLVALTKLLEDRRSTLAIGGGGPSLLLESIHQRYADLSCPPKNGPFFNCREGIFVLLSGKNQGRQNPELPWSNIKKGSPEFLADTYARRAEAHFIVSFSLALFGDAEAPESRMLPSMRGLKGSAVTRRVEEIARQYEFAARDARLRALFDAPKSDLQNELARYKADLEGELQSLSEKIRQAIPRSGR